MAPAGAMVPCSPCAELAAQNLGLPSQSKRRSPQSFLHLTDAAIACRTGFIDASGHTAPITVSSRLSEIDPRPRGKFTKLLRHGSRRCQPAARCCSTATRPLHPVGRPFRAAIANRPLSFRRAPPKNRSAGCAGDEKLSRTAYNWGMQEALTTNTTAELTETAHGQMIYLPREFRLPGPRVSVRREGEAIVLEPIRQTVWPTGFFDSIRIGDPAFERPSQGDLPPAPLLE
jgi:virulence-associated protein VagC